MKSEQEIRKEIHDYEANIKEFQAPDDYDIRDKYRARICALELVLDTEEE